MSGRRGSNPRPIAWKAIALPTELLPLLSSAALAKDDFFFAKSEDWQQAFAKATACKWGEQDSNL